MASFFFFCGFETRNCCFLSSLLLLTMYDRRNEETFIKYKGREFYKIHKRSVVDLGMIM